MADESWALAMGEFASCGRDSAFLPGGGLVLFLAWVSTTIIGQAVGVAIQNPARWGLDFAFSALFVALLVGMWKGKAQLVPWTVVAVVAVAAADFLPGKWYILLGGLAGSVVGAMIDAK